MKLRDSIELHCDGNPFNMESPVRNIVSSAIVPANVKTDLLSFAKEGQNRFEEFVQNRLLQTSSVSIWEPMRKLKLKTFANCMEKTKVCLGDKVVKLKEERELLGRFLIIQGSRPELVPKLEDTVGEYEMSVVPRSLCTVDGSLYIPSDKAKLMHAIEEAKDSQLAESPQEGDGIMMDIQHRVLIVDAMAVLQNMKKTAMMKKVNELKDAFIQLIYRMMTGYNEGRIMFDRYIDQSLKDKT